MKEALVDFVKKENAAYDNIPKAEPGPWEAFAPVPRDPEKEAADALLNYRPPDSVVAILSQTAMWVLPPPLVILAAAFVIGWIGRGFRPRASE
jgi:hypothetical protein